MFLSRISLTLSFVFFGLFSNLKASSSCSSLDDDSQTNFSLKRYLETTLSILEVLEVKLPEDRLVELENFKESLEDQNESVNFLAQFRDDQRIYKKGDRHGCIYYGVSEKGVALDPKPNVHMEFVYKDKHLSSQPIGMVLSFYALNNSGKREGHSIVKGHIPFTCVHLGNSFDLTEKTLKAHAEGLSPQTRVVHSAFFDLKASQEVQAFLGHIQVIEPYFKRVNLHQESEEAPLNPYESNMTRLFDFMRIPYEYISEDVDSSEEDDSGSGSNSDASSYEEAPARLQSIGAAPSPRTYSWMDWTANHKEILRDAKGDANVVAPECLRPLKKLLAFNPLNLKV